MVADLIETHTEAASDSMSLYPTLRRGTLMSASEVHIPFIPALNFTLPGVLNGTDRV